MSTINPGTHARWRLAIGIVILAGTVGCASRSERAEQSAWNDIARTRHAVEPQDSSTGSRATTPREPDPLASDSTLSIDELITLAERENDGLSSSFQAWRAALSMVPEARALPDPVLSYGYFVQAVETRVGPQRQRVRLAQRVPLGKLGLRGTIALHDANAARARYEAKRLALTRRVRRDVAEDGFVRRSIEVTGESVRLAEQLESVLRRQYAGGGSSHSALIRAQVELERLRVELQTLRDRRDPILARLNAALGRSPSAPLADVHDSAAVVTMTRDEALALLATHNPDLLEVEFRIAREDAAATLAGRGLIPDLTLAGEYIDTGPARFAGVPDSGKDAVIALASINVPLWFGKYGAEKDAASARRLAAKEERRQLERELAARVERAHAEAVDAQRRRELYRTKLLPKATQSLDATQQSFAAGDADLLDVVDAQRTLLEFELAIARADRDLAVAAAEVELLTGANLDVSPHPERREESAP